MIISEEDVDTVLEMVRQLVRDTKVRKLVLEHQDQVSKVFENDTVVTVDTLIEQGIVTNPKDGVKILGNGELTKKLTVQADAFSAGAVAKIEALGGKAEVI